MIDTSNYDKFLKGRIKDLIIEEKEVKGGRLVCGPFHMQYSYDIVRNEAEQRNEYKYRVNEFGGIFETRMRDVSKEDIVDFFLQRIFALYMHCRELFEIPTTKQVSHPDIIPASGNADIANLHLKISKIAYTVEENANSLDKVIKTIKNFSDINGSILETVQVSKLDSLQVLQTSNPSTPKLASPKPVKSKSENTITKQVSTWSHPVFVKEPNLFDAMGPGNKLDYDQYNAFAKRVSKFWNAKDILASRKKMLFIIIVGRILYGLTYKGLDTISGGKSGMKFRRWYESHIKDCETYKNEIKKALNFSGAFKITSHEWLYIVNYFEYLMGKPLSDNPDCV